MSDESVRRLIGLPSADCLVRKARLRYLPRFLAGGLPALNLVLSAGGPGGRNLPWIDTVINDFAVLKNFLARKLSEMPNPKEEPNAWWSFIFRFPKEWKQLVSLYHEMRDDDCHSPDPDTDAAQHESVCFSCELCESTFASAKARDQHVRIKHKLNISVYDHVPNSTVCGICGTIFGHRRGLVAHLSDKRIRSRVRGTSCGLEFLRKLPPALPPDVIRELRAHDNAAVKLALKEGHTHALVGKLACKVGASALKGIPSSVLRQSRFVGVRRRLTGQTSPAVALLKFEPCKRSRISTKTNVSFAVGDDVARPKRFRVSTKSVACSLWRPQDAYTVDSNFVGKLVVRKRIMSKSSLSELADKGHITVSPKRARVDQVV